MNYENNMASSYSVLTVFLEVWREKRIDGIYERKMGDLIWMFLKLSRERGIDTPPLYLDVLQIKNGNKMK